MIMDRLFSSNVEDKEVLFKKSDNQENVIENIDAQNSQNLSQKSSE